MGNLTVEVRPIDFFEEVHTFKEVGAVGTAAIVVGVASLAVKDKVYRFERPLRLPALRKHIDALQRGELVGHHGYLRTIIPASVTEAARRRHSMAVGKSTLPRVP
eukprot:NODE_7968_length_409_cov_20.768362.p3 GENE.NODE_7968_length_409_cov_20.768362~~NODE_7968_length_409_cov_20.768362.p3  ORF type:complete len:105 (+),score=32.95 NODE_7968_length_409_cov_20.768362:3-317(+)